MSCHPKMQQSQRDFYTNYGANIVYEEEPYGHTDPIDAPEKEASDCGPDGEFPCNNGNDIAGKILTHLMTNIPAFGVDAIEAKDADWKEKGVWSKFR